MPDTTTPYLGLTKPDFDGPADETVLNTNLDIIDAAFANLPGVVGTGVVATAVDYTVLPAVGVVAATGAITVTLPTAVGRTLPIIVKKMDAGTTTTVQTTGGQTVDGVAPPVLMTIQNMALTFFPTGAAWIVV